MVGLSGQAPANAGVAPHQITYIFIQAFRNTRIEADLTKDKKERRRVPKGANRMPSDSMFYDRLVPIVLIALGVITVALILVAAGILLGVI